MESKQTLLKRNNVIIILSGAGAAAGVTVLAILLFLAAGLSANEKSQPLPESTHGASHTLGTHVRPPSFSSEKEKELVSIAKAVPGLKEWSPDEWQVMSIGYLGSTEPEMHWTQATVDLELPVNATAPAYCEFGWAASVIIDLDTMEVVSAAYPAGRAAVCGFEFGGRLQ